MNPLPGFVYFDPNFEFEDGTKGKKLFVVLCDSPFNANLVLVARTTTTDKSEKLNGCHQIDQYEPVFFLSKDGSTFPEDTWIRLDHLPEYRRDILTRWLRKGDLTLEQTRDLMLCASRSDLIPVRFKESLLELGNSIAQAISRS